MKNDVTLSGSHAVATQATDIVAGNNVTIAAVGDNENSDLTVRGSDITAGK
jgi:hypothetical protein